MDEGISGTKTTRPGLDAMLEACRLGKVDVIAFWHDRQRVQPRAWGVVGEPDRRWSEEDSIGGAMPAPWVHKFVVYRIDHYLGHEGRDSPADLITIKAVVDSEAEAIAEVARLTDLRGSEGSQYLWQCAKYYPEGR